MTTQHVVNVSGGKDSTALYLLAMEQLGHDFLPVFCDTGNEHEATYEYVATLAERTGGPQITIVKRDFSEHLERRKAFVQKHWPGDAAARVIAAIEEGSHEDSPFLHLCLWKGMFPSNVRRFCTQEVKIISVQRAVIDPIIEAGDAVWQWMGIRADESKSRSTAPSFKRKDNGAEYNPLLYWSIDDVWAMHKRHGIAPNPLYAMGFTRVGCFPCIMARKSEISLIVRKHPEHWERIRRWEKLVQRASKNCIPAFFPCTKTLGTSIMRSTAERVAYWATGTFPGQLRLPITIDGLLLSQNNKSQNIEVTP